MKQGFIVYWRDGRMSRFETREGLLAWLKRRCLTRYRIGLYVWKVDPHLVGVGHNWNDNCSYIVTEAATGRVVHKDVLEDETIRFEERCWQRWNRPDTSWEEFRGLTVPHTGSNRWRGGGYRHPRTTQERRASQEHPRLVRGRRNKANLVNAWDDVLRSWYKSWKHCTKKRKQWM